MSRLGIVEDTLFVPMLGRIYASEYCPQILYDSKALELKKKLPSSLPEQDGQSQYTLIASAARSANMDRYIRAFLECRPNGMIVQLGCGLETAYYRCDNGRSRWYAVDLPHVVEYRRELLPEPERETYLAGDAFAECRGSAPCGGIPSGAAAGAGAGDLSRRRRLCRGLDQADPRRCAGCSHSGHRRRPVPLF